MTEAYKKSVMKEFSMLEREGKKKNNNWQVMAGPTSERVFASAANTGYASNQNKYNAIKSKNAGSHTKNLLNEEKTMKENVSMDLINDLFGASKKRQKKASNRNLASKCMEGLIQ